MELFNLIGLDIGYVVIGMAAVIILLFILLIVSMVKSHNEKTYLISPFQDSYHLPHS